MPVFSVTIHQFRKPTCLNPEEPTTLTALHSLGFTQIDGIRMGGCFVLKIIGVPDATCARTIAEQACDKLLVNAVTNQYQIEGVEEV